MITFVAVLLLPFLLPNAGQGQSHDIRLYDRAPPPPGGNQIEFTEFLSESFEWPMDFTFIDADNMLVCEKKGTVYLISGRVLQQRSVFLDISHRVHNVHSAGMYSIALHPAYPEDPRVFISYCTNAEEEFFHNQVSEFTVDVSDTPFVIPASEKILIRHEHPYNFWAEADGVVRPHSIHIGSEIGFGPDGYLYFSMGDGRRIVQQIDGDFFSGFHRIDIDRHPENLEPNPHPLSGTAYYKIPADNPYVGLTEFGGEPIADGTLRSEYFAVGLRNPWRHTFGPDGRIYLTDPGLNEREEVNLILPGRNYGWDTFEGEVQHKDGLPPGETHTPPLYAYEHGNTAANGNSVSDVFLYQGSEFPELKDKLIFTDFYRGHVRHLDPDATNVPATVVNFANLRWITSIEEDPADRELIFAEARNGKLMKLRLTPEEAGPVEKLSQTGFFTNLQTREANPAAIAYSVNVPFWSDAAAKRRWVIMPDETARIQFSASNDNIVVPEGTIFCKHFDLELDESTGTNTIPLETRFIIKRGGTFRAFTYKWDAPDYTDATLVREAGEQLTLDRKDFRGDPVQQRWFYPSRAQCMSCHNQQAGPVLGFTYRQLNTLPLNRFGYDQINNLALHGVVQLPAAETAKPVIAGWELDEFSHSFRVKSYFHVNCAPCHFPGNNRSHWDARVTTALNQSGIINGGLFSNLGDDANRLIAPGDPEHSVVLHRLSATNSLAMPPVGHSRVDSRAASEIRAWINSLNSSPRTYDQWSRLHFGEQPGPRGDLVANPDNDTYTNWQEWMLGLNPNSPLGAYRMQIETRPDTYVLRFPRQAYFNYQIEVCDGLANDTWRPHTRLDPLPYTFAADAPFAIELPTEDTMLFFRMMISPP